MTSTKLRLVRRRDALALTGLAKVGRLGTIQRHERRGQQHDCTGSRRFAAGRLGSNRRFSPEFARRHLGGSCARWWGAFPVWRRIQLPLHLAQRRVGVACRARAARARSSPAPTRLSGPRSRTPRTCRQRSRHARGEAGDVPVRSAHRDGVCGSTFADLGHGCSAYRQLFSTSDRRPHPTPNAARGGLPRVGAHVSCRVSRGRRRKVGIAHRSHCGTPGFWRGGVFSVFLTLCAWREHRRVSASPSPSAPARELDDTFTR